jgi:Tol biopolymer transport system component/DNA-binding winged helix-turn-helix (wHTH) protein
MNAHSAQGYAFGSFILDVENRLLFRDGHAIAITPKAFDALLQLVEGHGRLVTKEDLIRVLWPNTFVTESNLTQTIFLLRKALGETAGDQRYVVTVPGRGYRLAAAVREVLPDPQGPLQTDETAALPREDDHPGAVAVTSAATARRWQVFVPLGMAIVAGLGMYVQWSRPEGIAPADAGAPGMSMPRPLTSFPGIEADPAWSADGRQVAFTWNGADQADYDLYLLRPESSQTLRLTTAPGTDANPAWSPDGRSIAYVHVAEDEGKRSLNLISPLGGVPHVMFTHAAKLGAPQWTPDGRAIIFELTPAAGRPSEIWSLSTGTAQRQRLTSPPAGSAGDVSPAISPDGRVLAFPRKTAWRTSELYLLDLDPEFRPAGEPRRVTDLGYVGWPAWTPDGGRILFEGSREGVGIWQLELASMRLRPVYGVPDTASQPAVARQPGGHSALVFTNRLAEQSIWRFSTARGSGEPPLELLPSSRSQRYARYSNDGRRLAFSSTRTGHEEIWVANADGSHPVQLTFLRNQLTEAGHWAPDDGAIAFVSQDRAGRQIYVIAAGGGQPLRLTSEERVDTGSGWSRDGNAYYYTSSRSGQREVWKVRRDGGSPEQITVGGGEAAFESRQGILYYWTRRPDGTMSLKRRQPQGDREVDLTPAGIPPAVVAPDGFYYISAGTQDIYLFQEETGASVRVMENPGKPHKQFTISPDGRWFASGFLRSSSVDLMIMEHFR